MLQTSNSRFNIRLVNAIAFFELIQRINEQLSKVCGLIPAKKPPLNQTP